MNIAFEPIKQKISELETLITQRKETPEKLEFLYFNIKEQMDSVLEIMPAEEHNIREFAVLQKRLSIIHSKLDLDEFIESNELDNMFPNRSDDDFNEDSTSYESVFGCD